MVLEVGLEPTRYSNFATASQAAVAAITPFEQYRSILELKLLFGPDCFITGMDY